MARHKDANWNLPEKVSTYSEAHAAILMDIRDELKAISRVLHCPNCLNIPFKLDKIVRNTAKPKRKRPKSN